MTTRPPLFSKYFWEQADWAPSHVNHFPQERNFFITYKSTPFKRCGEPVEPGRSHRMMIWLLHYSLYYCAIILSLDPLIPCSPVGERSRTIDPSQRPIIHIRRLSLLRMRNRIHNRSRYAQHNKDQRYHHLRRLVEPHIDPMLP